jgi:hypothetical protein
MLLQEHERETRLSLAKSARRMAKEKEKNPNAILNVAILTGAEKPERAIDARECQDSGD